MRGDLSRAGIVYRDEQGRRADLHALRVTFGTNSVLSGAHPRVAQELMQHSDVRLTINVPGLSQERAENAEARFRWA
jgi:site-specific recombinase XerD